MAIVVVLALPCFSAYFPSILYDALMTFAEIIFFVLFIAVIYRGLRPLQRRLEKWIHRKLVSSRKPGSQKPPIDITDYKKNN